MMYKRTLITLPQKNLALLIDPSYFMEYFSIQPTYILLSYFSNTNIRNQKHKAKEWTIIHLAWYHLKLVTNQMKEYKYLPFNHKYPEQSISIPIDQASHLRSDHTQRKEVKLNLYNSPIIPASIFSCLLPLGSAHTLPLRGNYRGLCRIKQNIPWHVPIYNLSQQKKHKKHTNTSTLSWGLYIQIKMKIYHIYSDKTIIF